MTWRSVPLAAFATAALTASAPAADRLELRYGVARQVDHPRVRIIVDFYHLTFEDDRAEPRYRRFFENLRKIGYHGRISVEAESQNLAADCGPTLSFLKKMAAPADR